MKKGSLFLIVVVCIVSVVVISFFGTKVEMGQFQTYMTSITITNDNIKTIGNDKYLTVYFDDENGYISVYLDYSYTPDDATYPSRVKFTLTNNTYVDEYGNTQYYATISQNGEVVFLKRKAVTAIVTTTDGSQLSDSVTIVCR